MSFSGGRSSGWVDYDTTRGSKKRSTRSTHFGSVASATLDDMKGDCHSAKELFPMSEGKVRSINCFHKHPIVDILDVTGSMGDQAYVAYDRASDFFKYLHNKKYLEDPAISFAAVGDADGDNAPIQICQFSQSTELLTFLKKIWLEGKGGGQSCESYEMMMYYYALHCTLDCPEIAFFFITGDEGFYNPLKPDQIKRYFGDKVKAIDPTVYFELVKEKFMGNVFRLNIPYHGGSPHILAQWREVLGTNVIELRDTSLVTEIKLGLIALTTRTRTLDTYLEDADEFIKDFQDRCDDGRTAAAKKKDRENQLAELKDILIPYSQTITALAKVDVRGLLPIKSASTRGKRTALAKK